MKLFLMLSEWDIWAHFRITHSSFRTHIHTQESQLTGTIPPPHLLLSSVDGESLSGRRWGISQNHTWLTLASRVLLRGELGVRSEGWHVPVIRALRRWKQEELEFKVNLRYQHSRPAWALTGFCGCPESVNIMQVFMSFDTEMWPVLRHTAEGPKVSGNAPVPNTLPTSLLQRWRLNLI